MNLGRILGRALTALIVVALGLGLNMSPAAAAPCAPGKPASSSGLAQSNAVRPAHPVKAHKQKPHGLRKAKPAKPANPARPAKPASPGASQGAGLGVSPGACGSKQPQQATPPSEALLPPVQPPVAGAPAPRTSTGAHGTQAPATSTTAVLLIRSAPATAHTSRPASASRVTVIRSLFRRIIRDAPPAIETFAVEPPLASLPLLFTALLLVAFALVQRWIDRGDPKLANNAKPDPLLPFT